MPQRTPEQIELSKLKSRLVKRFHRACADYALIEEGDHILIGLSGGKDSLALVELLGQRSQIYVPRFRVTAIHVRMREIQYESDTQYLEQFCQQHHVPLIIRQASIGDAESGKSHCFLCSWFRRKMLFDVAQELGCNKIALGHHRDDIVETLLMNLVHQGSFSTIAPKLQMDKMPIQMIRPLCLIDEQDLKRYAQLCQYQPQTKLCPFEHESSRAGMKQIVAQLRQMNPNALDSIWGAMTNIKTEYLPQQPQGRLN